MRVRVDLRLCRGETQQRTQSGLVSLAVPPFFQSADGSAFAFEPSSGQPRRSASELRGMGSRAFGLHSRCPGEAKNRYGDGRSRPFGCEFRVHFLTQGPPALCKPEVALSLSARL